MSKKNSKTVSGLEQLGSLVSVGLDVAAGVNAVVPALIIGDWEITVGYEQDVDRMLAAAEHICNEFRATQQVLIAEYQGLLSDKGRIVCRRVEMVSLAMNEALQAPQYLATVEMYKALGKDASVLPALLKAHYTEQAEKIFADEMSAIEVKLDERKAAYEAALVLEPTAIPKEADELITKAAQLKSEVAQIRGQLAASLEEGGTW